MRRCDSHGFTPYHGAWPRRYGAPIKKMQDEKTIDKLICRAVVAGLNGVEFIQDFDYATLCHEYNGIGPEWAGAAIIAKATEILSLFEPAALIHDMRNYMSDGSREGFNYANMEFHANCLKLADHAYPWWNWRRYRARFVAHALYDLVRGDGGWKAWTDCYVKSLTLKS